MLTLALSTLFAVSPAECRQAYADVHYREAANLCLAAVPGASGAQLLDCYRFAGLSLAALGETEQARTVFESLLALDPKATLDASLSPKLVAPFEAAKAGGAATGASVRATLPTPPKTGERVLVRAEVDDGPARPVARVAARAAGTEQTVTRENGPLFIELPPPQSGPLRIDLDALDRFGGRLATTSLVAELSAAPAATPSRRPWVPWAIAAAGSAVLCLGSGGLSALEVSTAMTAPFGSDAFAARQRAIGFADGAYALAGVVGALGLIAVIVGLTSTGS
jgi:hypothetical protein